MQNDDFVLKTDECFKQKGSGIIRLSSRWEDLL